MPGAHSRQGPPPRPGPRLAHPACVQERLPRPPGLSCFECPRPGGVSASWSAPHTWPSAASTAQHRPDLHHRGTHLVTHGLQGPEGCPLPSRLQEAPGELRPRLAPTPWHHATRLKGRSAHPAPAGQQCQWEQPGHLSGPPRPSPAHAPLCIWCPSHAAGRRCSPRGLTLGGAPQAWGGAAARHLRTSWHRPPCPRVMQTGSDAGRNCATGGRLAG